MSVARARGLAVAFIRGNAGAQTGDRAAGGWLKGFEPVRSDVLLDRRGPSCYTSEYFDDVAQAAGGDIVLAGFAGQGGCLATRRGCHLRGAPDHGAARCDIRQGVGTIRRCPAAPARRVYEIHHPLDDRQRLDRLVERVFRLGRSMRVKRRDRVTEIAGVLEEQMRILESIGLAETASLLRIAWLDLKRRHGSISMEELEAVCARISATSPNARHKVSTKPAAAGSKIGPEKGGPSRCGPALSSSSHSEPIEHDCGPAFTHFRPWPEAVRSVGYAFACGGQTIG